MDRMKNKLPFPVRGLANGGPFGRIGRGLQQAGQWLTTSGPAPTSPLTPGFNGQMPPVRPPMSVPANAQTPGFNPNANTPRVGNPGVIGAASAPMSRNVPPPPQAQPTGSAQDAYKAALSIPAPQPRTSPLQRIAAMGAAGMGGLVNASGRARISPEVIRGAAMNIKHPNFPGRMREYQGGIDRAKAAADAERQGQQDALNERKITSEAEYREAMADAARSVPASDLEKNRQIVDELRRNGVELTQDQLTKILVEGKVPTGSNKPQSMDQLQAWSLQSDLDSGDPEKVKNAQQILEQYGDKAASLNWQTSVDDVNGTKTFHAFNRAGELVAERTVPNRKRESAGGGSFRPEYDAEGNLLGYYNPTTGQKGAGGFAGSQKPMSATLKKRKDELSSMLSSLDTLSSLAEKHSQYIGPVAGRVTAATRGTLGVIGASGQNEAEVQDMYRISEDLADRLLRARSGAQINEREFVRLRALVPDPQSKKSKFDSDMRTFRAELEGLLAAASPSGGAASPATSEQGAPPPPTPQHVLMKNPSTGTVGWVSPDKVQAAESRQFTRVQ